MNETMIAGLACLLIGCTLGLLMGALAAAAGQADAAAERDRVVRMVGDRLDLWRRVLEAGTTLSLADQLHLIYAAEHWRRDAERLRAERSVERDPKPRVMRGRTTPLEIAQ